MQIMRLNPGFCCTAARIVLPVFKRPEQWICGMDRGIAMTDFDESALEFANFIFDRKKVVCYGLQNAAGGTTTILNFPAEALADAFRGAFLQGRNFRIIQNGAQIICLADYDTVMRRSTADPRVQPLRYSRDYMMGTLSHMVC